MLKNFPLRVFFIYGWLAALLGGGLWILRPFPLFEHSRILMGGFLFGYSAGFLLTAVPVFLESNPPKRFLVVTSAASLFVSTLAALMQNAFLFHIGLLGCILLVIAALAQCLLSRKNNLPPFFLFVGLGMVAGIFSNVVLAFEWGSYELQQFARILLFEGMILSFVIGIGSRILPVLFGYRESVLEKNARPGPTVHWHIVLGVIAFAATFFIESFVNVFAGRIARALLIGTLVLSPLKLYRLPLKKNVVPILLWLSMWALVVGEFGNALSAYSTAWLHLTFISGFALMTLMVALHVLIEREHFAPQLETDSKLIGAAGVSLILAAFLRFWGSRQMDLALTLLTSASVFWIVSFLLWAFAIMKSSPKR